MFSLLCVICFSHLNSFLLFTSSQLLPLLIVKETGQNQPIHTAAYPCLHSSQSWSQTFWPCSDSLQCACSERQQNSPQRGREGAWGKKTPLWGLCIRQTGNRASGDLQSLFMLVRLSGCELLLQTASYWPQTIYISGQQILNRGLVPKETLTVQFSFNNNNSKKRVSGGIY